MTARLRVSGMWSRRGSETVLRNLSLTLDAGELVLVTGTNGSGKSTLLESIAGVIRPAAGEVWLDGVRIDGRSADQIARCGVSLVHQQRRLFSSLTVHENIALADFAGGRRGPLDAVDGMLDRLGIARLANTTAGLLSGGEQRLVAVARALRSRPSVLLLDEPLAALADDLRDHLLAELKAVAGSGAAVLVVEHDCERVRPYADHELMLRMGDLVSLSPAAATL
ncbi:MAG: ATP-binding cassette domain-containing protein [Candidatus Dormibacteraeota bacterium]|nr:ATP-binding cassette domain-containing protein [Candidatus Dormibacteraeota bacterium]